MMSKRTPVTLALVLTLGLAFSGCAASNGPGGQSVEAGGGDSASLSYNGANAGSHEKSVSCDGSGKVNYNTNLGSGKITVQVMSGGQTLFSKDIGGPGQASATKDVSGPAGAWVLKVTRGVGYSGQYNVNLDC